MPEPLAADQYSIRFAAEPLPEREVAELVAHGRSQFAKLFGNIRFATESGFGTKVRSSSRSTRAIICVPTQIRATLEEVADVFFSDRTNAAIGFAQSQSIYNVLEPSTEHPLRSCGLRWSLWHSPSKLIRQRDICYIEYMDTFVDANGRRGWARCTPSIVHRSCPPLMSTHGIVRAHLGCSGTVYTETDTPGLLDVVTLYDCDTKGVPAWMTKFVAARKAKNPRLLEHLIRLARAANESLVADFTKTVVAPQFDRACFGCGDELPKWSLASRKCRECHELLCKSCNDIVYCAVEGGKKLNRICMHCVDRFLAADGDSKQVDMYTDSNSNAMPEDTLVRNNSDASSFLSVGCTSDDESVFNSARTTQSLSSTRPQQLQPPPPPPPVQQPKSFRQPTYQQQYQQMMQKRHQKPPTSTPALAPQPTQNSTPYQRPVERPSPPRDDRVASAPLAPVPAPPVTRYARVASNPKLISVNAIRNKPTRAASSAAAVDLSYLSTFKTAPAASS